ncbi:MAG: T9SS type A sorting domain-containing protein [Chlorobi bacterium]|nr:T9SS type A sorting domain-containing protein [Chlorobiota bacterium]
MDNVLQYYWVLTATGFTDFSGTTEFYYNENDVKVTAPYDVYDYITAKLLNDGTGNWVKYDNVSNVSKFDETNKKLIFDYSNVSDVDISGDYTAGVDGSTFLGAIPDQVPLYVSKGVAGGGPFTNLDWHTADTWRVDDGTGTWVLPASLGLPDIPDGARVRIYTGDRVTTAVNYISAYTTEILGTLDVGTTFGNRIGNVSGTGTLYSERGSLPAGFYEDFFSASGGTVEFGGSTNYCVLSQITQVNNLTFSGTGKRELPNLTLTILGDLLFSDNGTSSPDVINEFDQTIKIRGDITYNAGTFDAGLGADAIIEFAGTSAQNILGTSSFTGTNAFNHLTMNNSSGLTLSRSVDINYNLNFTSGVIHTTTTNILTLENTNETVVTGAGSGNYVDGPLNKNIIIGGKFLFPVGNNTRYGYVILDNIDQSNYWQAEYYNHNPLNDGYDPANFLAPIKVVSENEFWRINGPASSSSYVELRWDASSGVSSVATERDDLRVAEWISANSRWEVSHSTATASGSATDGTVTTNPTSPALNGNHIFTLTSQLLITNTWEGNISTVWSDAGNWSAGTVPTGSSDAIIPTNPVGNRFPEINVAAHCHKLDIQSSATVTVNAAKSLTLNGDFTNDGMLLLKSPADETASASFIDNGTTAGSGTVHIERYFSANKFHYVSSPIQSGGNASSDLFTQSNSSGNFNPNFYVYDETFDLDGNAGTAPAGAFNSDNLVSGWVYAYPNQTTDDPMKTKTGYAFYTDENQLITFIGTPNTGDISINGLAYTNNDQVSCSLPNYYDGWDLVANPYPSAIDWDVIKSSRTNLDDGIYVWDGTQYSSYANGVKGGNLSLSNEIAPMQAFFVHATANSAGFSLHNSNRVHSTQNYLKSPNKNNANEDIPNFIRLKMQANGYSDYAVVYFKSNATSGFDGDFDALKLFSNIASVPHIYSISQKDKTPLSINVLPENSMADLIVPIAVKIEQAGTYTISADKFNFKNNHVYFIDKQKNVEIYLNENALNNYSFYCDAGIISDRFELHFYKNNAPEALNQIKDTTVFEDRELNFILPKNSFIETDKNDKISGYYAKLENDNDLPEWLTFNNKTLTFSGIPKNEDVGILTIKVFAFDKMGATGYQEFNLSVINTNDAPFVENSIPDMETYTSELYSYTIPNNIFNDIDFGDLLTYSAQSENGNQLPEWLSFNTETKTFSGIPENAGVFQIKVKATDIAGANTSDIYTLTVKGSSDISNVSESDFNIYPNPTTGRFFIANSKPVELHYIITDITGSIIKEEKSFTNKEEINLTGFGAGIYFIKIQNETKTLSFKIILQK